MEGLLEESWAVSTFATNSTHDVGSVWYGKDEVSFESSLSLSLSILSMDIINVSWYFNVAGRIDL